MTATTSPLACDISDPAALDRLAQEAGAAGPLAVLLLDAFVRQAVRGRVPVCIASSAGYMLPLDQRAGRAPPG
jgi:hypothetical protein